MQATVSRKHPFTLMTAVLVTLSYCHRTKQWVLLSFSAGGHSSFWTAGTHCVSLFGSQSRGCELWNSQNFVLAAPSLGRGGRCSSNGGAAIDPYIPGIGKTDVHFFR